MIAAIFQNTQVYATSEAPILTFKHSARVVQESDLQTKFSHVQEGYLTFLCGGSWKTLP